MVVLFVEYLYSNTTFFSFLRKSMKYLGITYLFSTLLLLKLFCFYSDFDESWLSNHEWVNIYDLVTAAMLLSEHLLTFYNVCYVFVITSVILYVGFLWCLYWSLFRVFAMPSASTIFPINAVGIRHAVGVRKLP